MYYVLFVPRREKSGNELMKEKKHVKYKKKKKLKKENKIQRRGAKRKEGKRETKKTDKILRCKKS